MHRKLWPNNMKRWIMHVDMDAFFASVEQHDHPEYQGHPLIVGGLSSRGVVATCSYEARAYGVRSAMPITQAKERCPDGIYVRPNMERYQEVSSIIHQVLHEFSPYLEPLSLDEAFLDISGLGKLYPGPMAVGRAVKAKILEATGLIASVGIGPNKFLAKLASDLKKPDGLYLIPHGEEMRHIGHLPIRRLWGVGPRLEALLQKGGFFHIKDIASLPSFHPLESYCGHQSERIYDMAKGIDHRPIEWDREVQSIGNELTYERDISTAEEIDAEWHYFAHRVAKRLREKGLKGHTIAIKVRRPDFTTLTRQKRLSYRTDREDVLYDTACLLYNKLTVKGPFRLLGITVSGFYDVVEQVSLFQDEEQSDSLAETIDALEARFGEAIITTGALWQRQQRMEDEDHQEHNDES